jgi:hypothetical protein
VGTGEGRSPPPPDVAADPKPDMIAKIRGPSSVKNYSFAVCARALTSSKIGPGKSRTLLISPPPGAGPGATLCAGQVVVMDDLCAHKGGRVKEIIEGGLRALVCAALLAGLRSDRASVLEGQGAPQASRGSRPRIADGGYGSGALCGVGWGRSGILRPLRLRFDGSPAMTGALGLRLPSSTAESSLRETPAAAASSRCPRVS